MRAVSKELYWAEMKVGVLSVVWKVMISAALKVDLKDAQLDEATVVSKVV